VTIDEYLKTVKERLFTDPAVVSFELMRERAAFVDGYIRARLAFPDQSYLEFSEYVQVVDDEIKVVTYSYHWATDEDRLIKRWDNTPHFPKLPGFPHHIHDGEEVVPGYPVDIFFVLDEIAQSLDPRP
jgi:hypothetical protein